MECKYNQDEFCTNSDCPMCADYCPVPDIEGVCQYEDRVEVKYKLSPKGCLILALAKNDIYFDSDKMDAIWKNFEENMTISGYITEE